MFGCDRFGYQPDMITFAKGVTSGYAPLGGVIVSNRVSAPFVEDQDRMYMHGLTFGGHPVSCAVALANIEIMEREDICGHVRAHEELFDDVMNDVASLPIVGEVRGCGYFRVAELVRDKDTRETFTPAESDWLLRGFLSPAMYKAGLICRSDDRADPVVVLSPTLVAGERELEFIRDTLKMAFSAAWDALRTR
jgi:adenosylmethionine-8-amino-7-oxononanoate aminotransferase